MIKPRKGYFCKVLTSTVFADQIGYVDEVTEKGIRVIFKGGRVGSFAFDKNNFMEIHSWFGDGVTSIDDRIDALKIVDFQLTKQTGANTFPETTLTINVSDWLKERNL